MKNRLLEPDKPSVGQYLGPTSCSCYCHTSHIKSGKSRGSFTTAAPQFVFMIAASLHILYMGRAQNKNKASETIYYIIVFPSNAATAGVDAFSGVLGFFVLFCFSIFLAAAFSSSYQKKGGVKNVSDRHPERMVTSETAGLFKADQKTPVVSGNKCALGGPDHPHGQPDRISLLFSFQHLKSLKCFPI